MSHAQAMVFVYADGRLEVRQAEFQSTWLLPREDARIPVVDLEGRGGAPEVLIPRPHVFEIHTWRHGGDKRTTRDFYVERGATLAHIARGYARALELPR